MKEDRKEARHYAISKRVAWFLGLLALAMLVLVAIRPQPASPAALPTAQTPAQHAATLAAQATTVTAGCVLRGDGGWHIHANSTHYCNAITGLHVETDGDLALDLNNGEFGAVKVGYQDPGVDETFSKFATCGASGGLGTTIIRCWDKDNPGHLIRADDPRFDTPLGNFWFIIVWQVPA